MCDVNNVAGRLRAIRLEELGDVGARTGDVVGFQMAVGILVLGVDDDEDGGLRVGVDGRDAEHGTKRRCFRHGCDGMSTQTRVADTANNISMGLCTRKYECGLDSKWRWRGT